MKKHITLACLAALTLTVQAQQGGISNEMLKQIRPRIRIRRQIKRFAMQ